MTNMTGIFIPIEILQDTNLSINEKIILSLVKNMKTLFMSNKSLSDLLGISKSRVSHIITELNKKGYVDVELTYTEEKQVEKRTVRMKQAVKKVQETVKRVMSKAKELKADYVPVSKMVGTEKVQQQSFGSNFYARSQKPFNRTYSHNWDLEELERMERQYIKSKCIDESIEEMQERLRSLKTQA